VGYFLTINLYRAVRQCPWRSVTTAGLPDDQQTITITHPFSPLKGQKLFLIERIKVCGEDKIICCDNEGNSRMVLTSWTDYLSEEHIPTSISTADFKFNDLYMLAKLISDIQKTLL